MFETWEIRTAVRTLRILPYAKTETAYAWGVYIATMHYFTAAGLSILYRCYLKVYQSHWICIKCKSASHARHVKPANHT